MSGRGRGRGRGRGHGRNISGKPSGRGNNRFNKNSKPVKTKLEDHVFHLGTARQASDYDTNKDFIVNHIKQEFDEHPLDIANALIDLKHPITKTWEPQTTDFVSSETVPAKKKRDEEMLKEKYKMELTNYYKRENAYKTNKVKAYGLIWARCSPAMKAQLEGRDDFTAKILDDPVELLKAIKQHALNYKEHRYEMSIICDALKTWLLSKQKEGEGLIEYTKRYQTSCEVLESLLGGPIVLPNFIKQMEEYKGNTAEEFLDSIAEEEQALPASTEESKKLKKLKETAFEQLKAYVYMENADKKVYGSLLNTLSQQQSLKHDQYPKTVLAAKQVLNNHRADNAKEKAKEKKDNSQRKQNPGNGNGNGTDPNVSPVELSFAQLLKDKCNCCGKTGHWAYQCHKKDSIPKEQWAINIAKKKDAAFAQSQAAGNGDDSGTVASNANPPSTVSAPATFKWSGAQLRRVKGVQLFLANQVDMSKVILLDNESTTSIFCNPNYVINIRESKDDELELETNGGLFTTKTMATLPGFSKDIWFDEQAITNILAFHEVTDQYHITYDSTKEDAFIVQADPPIKFTRAPNGLYYYIPSENFIAQVKAFKQGNTAPCTGTVSNATTATNERRRTSNARTSEPLQAEEPNRSFYNVATTTNDNEVEDDDESVATTESMPRLVDPKQIKQARKAKAIVQANKDTTYWIRNPAKPAGVSMVQTVDENKKFYTDRQFSKAKKARELLHQLGSPTVEDLKKAIRLGIKNSPVSIEDVILAEKIFGPDVGSLKGKTTRTKTAPPVQNYIEIPPELLKAQENVTLCIDGMWVNGLQFLTTVSKNIKYRTATYLPNKKMETYKLQLKDIAKLYNKGGFVISQIKADNEFKPLIGPLEDELDTTMDFANPQDHVSPAERNNRVIKERIRQHFIGCHLTDFPISCLSH